MARRRPHALPIASSDRNEKLAGSLSDTLILNQLQDREREEEEKRLFEKKRLKDIVR